MLELAFEGENCSFMDRNSCHPAGSVFLTFLGTNERKVASLAPDAFDTGLQVGPCPRALALPVGLLLDSPVAVQSVRLTTFMRRVFLFGFQGQWFACYYCSHPLLVGKSPNVKWGYFKMKRRYFGN